MAEIAFIANGTGNFSDSTKWSTGVVPVITDEVIIGSTGNTLTGVTAIARPALNADATDAATTQALTNQIRKALAQAIRQQCPDLSSAAYVEPQAGG